MKINKNEKVYLAGHTGLVGSTLLERLKESGYKNIVTKTFEELDLRRQDKVEKFFKEERPSYVFLCAARVGGILANNNYKADFIYDNLAITTNVINASHVNNVKKLVNFGSSCIYPKNAQNPIKEEYLLTGPLEPTNEPFAISKIAALKLCESYNEQYNNNFVTVMPANLYGTRDNFDLETSHVLPALVRRFHLAKLLKEDNFDLIINELNTLTIESKKNKTINKQDSLKILSKYGIEKNCVKVWGTGNASREFLHASDVSDGAIFVMENYDVKISYPFVNLGTGSAITIKDLAYLIKDIVKYDGNIEFDHNKFEGTPKRELDMSKLFNLGWKPKVSLKEGIEKTYSWYLSSINTSTNKNKKTSDLTFSRPNL